jgi:hypothetical protein
VDDNRAARIEKSLQRIEMLLDLQVKLLAQIEMNTGAILLHTMPFFSRLRFSWRHAGAIIDLTEDEGKRVTDE